MLLELSTSWWKLNQENIPELVEPALFLIYVRENMSSNGA